jgi:2-methylcitrate dehydratase PrpD
VSARIARTAVGLETVRGFHNPGTQGPFGAAAAVGKLYGFDEDRLLDALGIAGSSSAGLLEFAWSGGDTKRLHLGRAAQLGLESALLARQGVRGPATVLEGRSGYFTAFSTPPRIERLLEGLGTDWAIEPPSLKSYATHVTHQAVVDAIQRFKREQPLDPATITRVVIRGAGRIMEERHAERAPHDVLGGQYSLPFTTAVALTRDMANPLVYDEAAVRDPLVRDLARRIELEPRDDIGPAAPYVWPAEVIIERGGRSHSLRTRPHKGAPSNPFTWAEIGEKFLRYTSPLVAPSRATAVIDVVGRLEKVADMAEVAELVALP